MPPLYVPMPPMCQLEYALYHRMTFDKICIMYHKDTPEGITELLVKNYRPKKVPCGN